MEVFESLPEVSLLYNLQPLHAQIQEGLRTNPWKFKRDKFVWLCTVPQEVNRPIPANKIQETKLFFFFLMKLKIKLRI